MALQLRCPTDQAVLLLAVTDAKGTIRIPSKDPRFPGLWFKVKALQGINLQLMEVAESVLQSDKLFGQMHINQQFAGKVINQEGQVATLYVARVQQGVVEAKEDWLTMPELLSAMPKDRNRLPYLLAWQVLTGALEQNTKAVEVDDGFVLPGE